MCVKCQFSIVSSTAVTQEVTTFSSHLSSMKLCSTSITAKYLHKLFGMSLHGRTSILLHLFIYSITCLYWYGVTDIYFRLWVIIQYNFVYFIAQIVPVLITGSCLLWLLCPFDIFPSFCGVCVCMRVWARACVFEDLVTFSVTKLSYVFPASVLQSAVALVPFIGDLY